MQRQISGDNPDMETRFFVGRCVSSGVVRIIDLEAACELCLTIRQMTMITKYTPFFGLRGGDMSVGDPDKPLSRSHLTLRLPNMYLQGVMADDLELAFQKFIALLQLSFSRQRPGL